VQGTEGLFVPPVLPSEGKGNPPSSRVEGTRWAVDTQLLQQRKDWERRAALASSSKKPRRVSPSYGKRSNSLLLPPFPLYTSDDTIFG